MVTNFPKYFRSLTPRLTNPIYSIELPINNIRGNGWVLAISAAHLFVIRHSLFSLNIRRKFRIDIAYYMYINLHYIGALYIYV